MGYTLSDCVKRNKETRGRFEIPTASKIGSLSIGDRVKLVFLLDKPVNGCEAERMWVEITEIKGASFVGTLNNSPAMFKASDLKYGDRVEFKRENICAIE